MIATGQHWIVTGPRASGKTSLARALVGRRRLTSGSIAYPFLKGADWQERSAALRLVTFADESRLAHGPNRQHYYQQRYNAFDASGHPTVGQYLEAGGYAGDRHAGVIRAFGIGDLLDLEMIKLSSGQTRKVLLAGQLLQRPRLLVIDNPYVGLDAASRGVLNDLLDRLVQAWDVTLVLCGHVPDPPSSITHRLHLTGNGGYLAGPLREEGVDERPVPAPEAALRQLQLLWNTHPPRPVGEELIRLEDVTVGYGGRPILDGLDWQVRSGERWIVSGPNGSGKSTLLGLLYGDHPQAYANAVYLFGQRRGRGISIWDIKARTGFVSPELATHFRERVSAGDVVLTGYTDTFRKPAQITPDQQAMASALLRYFTLERWADVSFADLSSGTQRLLLLCRALVKAPGLLLLDEPFQGLDATDIQRARRLLAEVPGGGDTIIFISHFRPEVPEGAWRELRLRRPD